MFGLNFKAFKNSFFFDVWFLGFSFVTTKGTATTVVAALKVSSVWPTAETGPAVGPL